MPEQNTLIHSPESPDDELERLRERAAIIEGQTATTEQMHERIQELEARLAKDSHNSSRLPSSDSPFKKPPPHARRQPSGRKPGGQPGRRGVTRSLVDAPDQCVIIPLPGTWADAGGTEIATTGLAERRPVVEVVIQREVVEYRIVSRTCACGRAQRSTFPTGIKALVQYGPSGSAVAVYMTPYQLLPYQHTAEVLNEPERRHFLRNPKWGPFDFGCKKLGDGHGPRRPTCVLRLSRRAFRAAPGLPQ